MRHRHMRFGSIGAQRVDEMDERLRCRKKTAGFGIFVLTVEVSLQRVSVRLAPVSSTWWYLPPRGLRRHRSHTASAECIVPCSLRVWLGELEWGRWAALRSGLRRKRSNAISFRLCGSGEDQCHQPHRNWPGSRQQGKGRWLWFVPSQNCCRTASDARHSSMQYQP